MLMEQFQVRKDKGLFEISGFNAARKPITYKL